MADVLMMLRPAWVHAGDLVPVVVLASYTAASPWEVALAVMTVEDEAMPWSLHRETVRQGLDGVAGRGDAVVAPLPAAPGVLAVGLVVGDGPDSGQAVLYLPRAGVAGFLGACDRVVPPGSEQMTIPDSPSALGGAA